MAHVILAWSRQGIDSWSKERDNDILYQENVILWPTNKDKLCFMFLDHCGLSGNRFWFFENLKYAPAEQNKSRLAGTYKMLHDREHDLASFTETEIHTQTAQKLFRNLHD